MKRYLASLLVSMLVGWVSPVLAVELAGPPHVSKSPAPGLEFEVQAHGGAATLFGRGSDAVGIGPAATLFAGVKLHPLFAVHAMALLCDLPLLADEAVDERGQLLALGLAPRLYPLMGKWRFEPSVAPVLGYSYRRGAIGGSRSDVVYQSRAVVAGVSAAGFWTLRKPLAIGLSATALQLFIDRACVRINASTTSCDTQTGRSPRLVALQMAFRLRW